MNPLPLPFVVVLSLLLVACNAERRERPLGSGAASSLPVGAMGAKGAVRKLHQSLYFDPQIADHQGPRWRFFSWTRTGSRREGFTQRLVVTSWGGQGKGGETQYKLPAYGKILPLQRGALQLLEQLRIPKGGKPYRLLSVRIFNDHMAPVATLPLTQKRFSGRVGETALSLWEEPDTLYLFFSGLLDQHGDRLERVKVLVVDKKRWRPKGAARSFYALTGQMASEVPAFFPSAKGGGGVAVWYHGPKVYFSSFQTMGRVQKHYLVQRGLMAYFPQDIEGVVHQDGSTSFCWLGWNKVREQRFKKHLFCKGFTSKGVPRYPRLRLTKKRDIPATHRQVNPKALELLLDAFRLVPNGGDLMVVWSAKDLSERTFRSLGIYAMTLSPKGRRRYGRPQPLWTGGEKVQGSLKALQELRLWDATIYKGGEGAVLQLLGTLWEPLKGATLLQVRLPLGSRPAVGP